jgi:RecB family exonuclease
MPKTKTKVATLVAEATVLIDNAFTVDKAKWGTYRSYDHEGKALVTSPTEESCIDATRCYLKWLQEGYTTEENGYAGKVEGKL